MIKILKRLLGWPTMPRHKPRTEHTNNQHKAAMKRKPLDRGIKGARET